jgi:acyl phosphate:glycerol-3-phosphate acyltransferase
MLLYWIVGVIAYLLGSIPFGLILVRIFRKQDIRTQGSGNIGATNVIRSGGKGLGAVTFLLDAAKGLVAVLLAWQLALHLHQSQPQAQNLAATAALCAILGHIYPVWLRFKGGKGVATGLGVFLGIAPLSALVALIAFIIVFVLSRYVSLASIVAALVFPLAALLRHHEPLTPFMITVVILLPLIVIAKHHANIRRLLAGTEYRFGKSKAAAA